MEFLRMTSEQFRSYIKAGNRFNQQEMEHKGENKFHAKKAKVGDRVFDSTKESKRYLQLKSMMEQGQIAHLECQKAFTLIEPFTYRGTKFRGTSWIADFYYQRDDGQWVAEDCKSKITRQRPEYIIKKKLFMTNPKYRDILFNEFL